MNLKRHYKQRYCERILGIKDTELKNYMAQNDQDITNACNEIFRGSEFIWQGKLGQNEEGRFYLNDMIVSVADLKDENLITMYKIDFGFPDATNRKVRDDLLEIIRSLNDKYKAADESTKVEVAVNNMDIDLIDATIAHYESLIENLKLKRKSKTDANTLLWEENRVIYKEISKHAFQLCNSLDYKMDLMESRKVS